MQEWDSAPAVQSLDILHEFHFAGKAGAMYSHRDGAPKTCANKVGGSYALRPYWCTEFESRQALLGGCHAVGPPGCFAEEELFKGLPPMPTAKRTTSTWDRLLMLRRCCQPADVILWR